MRKHVVVFLFIFMCLLSFFPGKVFSLTLPHELPWINNGITYTDVFASHSPDYGGSYYYHYYNNPQNMSGKRAYGWGIPYGNGINNGYDLFQIYCDANNSNCTNAYYPPSPPAGSAIGPPICWTPEYLITTQPLLWMNSYSGLCGIGDVVQGTYFPANYGSSAPDTGTFKLPDTGQTICYDGTGNVINPCPAPGQPLAQDGSYSINPLSYTDNPDGTVTDTNTGLIWQKQDDGNTYNWYQASGTYDLTLNPTSKNVCGELGAGWRLPSEKELVSIVDYSIPYPGPTIATDYFLNTKTSINYWSSTQYVRFPEAAWYASFADAQDGAGYKGTVQYVRCVRGVPTPSPTLTDNGNGTVTDSSTGLMWQQGEPWVMQWPDALSYCEDLELPPGSGQRDWRLPNIRELKSLVDYTRWDPAIDTSMFPNAPGHGGYAGYLSSTTNASNPGYAFYLFSVEGGVGADALKINNYPGSGPVRCVRGGQTAGPPPSGNLVVSPTSYDFGDMFIGDCNLKNFQIKNTGQSNLSVPKISLSDTENFSFDRTMIYSCSTNGQIIGPNDFCNLVVKSCPTRTGNINSQFSVTSNDTNHPITNIPLSVTGKTLVTIGKFTPFGTIYQEIDPMKLIGAKEIILAYTNNTTSTKNLNKMQAYLARLNLHPIYQSADICVKGSSIDWEKVHVFINNVDWTDEAIFKRYSSSPNCDSAGAVAISSYWLNATVTPKISVRTTDGSVGTGEWTFYVNTNYLWPAGKDIAKGIALDKIKLIVQVIEGLIVPLPAQ